MTPITDAQFKEAADAIGCDTASIKTVFKVEANGSGFLDDGKIKGQHDPDDRVKILFEGHRFWKALKKAGANPQRFIDTNQAFSNVLYEDWDSSKYIGGVKEWDRMSRAIEVCNKLGMPVILALNSASYGAFQIMGENAQMCGYHDAHEMLAKFNNGGEQEQLKAFIAFVKSKRLDDELKKQDWIAFAKGYNGTAYRKNQYDVKLAKEYARISA